MEFDSYKDFKQAIEAIGFEVILGVKDTMSANTAYLTLNSAKKIGSDNFKFVIGYSYTLVASVEDADSKLIQQLSEVIDSIEFVNYSDASHLYSFSGSIYLPCGNGGQAWE
ncbi:hypothetical protein [Pseudolactococcus paracarnosus]|uniref:hypothetical protein n=1 Tax=Pseudolactococcus paracarnosus TaxID=2749962 RepID=UPI001FBA0E86|nr:hypothetical protein [Lactococcus paracarnosus]MCJ1998479.1 hypothetical protein [Lactococcus paracarnosus]